MSRLARYATPRHDDCPQDSSPHEHCYEFQTNSQQRHEQADPRPSFISNSTHERSSSEHDSNPSFHPRRVGGYIYNLPSLSIPLLDSIGAKRKIACSDGRRKFKRRRARQRASRLTLVAFFFFFPRPGLCLVKRVLEAFGVFFSHFEMALSSSNFNRIICFPPTNPSSWLGVWDQRQPHTVDDGRNLDVLDFCAGAGA